MFIRLLFTDFVVLLLICCLQSRLCSCFSDTCMM